MIINFVHAKNIFPFSLDDHTHNGVNVNLSLLHLGRGHLTRDKSFLIIETLKLGV